MKISYATKEDQLHIILADSPILETAEVVEGLFFDYDAAGNVVAVEIEHPLERLHLPAVARQDLTRALERATKR